MRNFILAVAAVSALVVLRFQVQDLDFQVKILKENQAAQRKRLQSFQETLNQIRLNRE